MIEIEYDKYKEMDALQNNKLETLSAEDIKRLIRLCHPDEHGEPYTRGDVISEISRRGVSILKELGYDPIPEFQIKNLFTGDSINLSEYCEEKRFGLMEKSLFEEILVNQAFSIIEHWEPLVSWTNEFLLAEYKRKGAQVTLEAFQ